MRMRKMERVLVLWLLSIVVVTATASVQQKQCILPKQYNFEAAMRLQQAAAERARRVERFLEERAEAQAEAKARRKQQQEEALEKRAKANEEAKARRKQQQEEALEERAKAQQEAKARRKQQQEEAPEERAKAQQEAKGKPEEQFRKRQEEAKRRQQQQQNNQNKKPCPYTVLGVGKDATQADIKSAYRRLAIQHHPDKNPGCEDSKEKFTLLVDAYEILGDEDRRVMYDEETFGQYQSRPHNYNSKAGFYTGNSFVTALNQTEFERLVMCKGPFGEGEECEPYMIHFYTPWCVHCKNMVTEWKRAASQMDGTETPLGYVNFAGVNCETNKQLCQNKGIRSYPEIYLYAQDENGQEHVEQFPSGKPRNGESFINFCEKGIRLAHESTLQSVDAFLMEKNVTNADSTGLWIVMFQGGRNCAQCGSLKASLRRMSANIGDLANFGVFDCDKEPKVCQHQYVGTRFPVLKLYPYKGAKGTGETLVQAGADPLVLLPVVEKVIRMCLANIEAENGLMKNLHEDEEEYEKPEQPRPQYEYPQPEQRAQRILPAGVRANGGRQHIGS